MKLKFILIAILFIPLLVFGQDANKKKAYFFYLDSCPHCHNVNDFFNANGIYDKYDIVKLDASIPQNGKFLMKLYEANSYPESQRGGVPVVAFGDKFFVGDKPIIDNFLKEIDAIDNPEVPNVPADIVVHEGAIREVSSASASAETTADEGNKKNYFPVIVGALVVIVAGALIFINRK